MDDSLKLVAGPNYNVDLHFAEITKVQRNLRRAIALNNPTFFGAAMHQYQDWWTHVNEGYGGALRHGPATAKALCRHNGACDGLIEDFYGMPLSQRVAGVRNNLSYLGVDLYYLSASQLMDVWLRERTGPRSPERELFGYDTDAYYPFTARDKAMERGTRDWIERFFAGEALNYPSSSRT
ncbi:MAG: hypothetical protein MN733_10995, partial [Nitrososphaera sp.]|nr:hypothetical protein [Nitrososphaera sp.]